MKLTNTTKLISIVIISIVIIAILTKQKNWNYEKTSSNEYNKEFVEKHPCIDTIIPYYKNVQPIFIRKFTIGGHAVIGEINGGSRNIIIHDIPNCEKCKKYLLPLTRDRYPTKLDTSNPSYRGTNLFP